MAHRERCFSCPGCEQGVPLEQHERRTEGCVHRRRLGTWDAWVRNEAVEVLSETESARVEATLRQRGELHNVLQPRFVFTDKNDVRTATHDLPIRVTRT